MEIVLLVVGKTQDAWIREGIDIYLQRMQRYAKTSIQVVANRDKQLEAIKPGDLLILLDERGKVMDTDQLAHQFQKWMNAGPRRLVFAVGDAYGFAPEFRAKSQAAIALGPLTFTHDMVRVIFMEQCYRCMTVLRNEPYHHR